MVFCDTIVNNGYSIKGETDYFVFFKGGIYIKIKQIFSLLLFVIFLCSFIYPNTSFATKWVHKFVVWNDYVYVVKDEYVTEIDKEIGQVTKYSDMEQHPGNFSNAYRKGTKYYSIKGISTDESIAVEDEKGKYIKAVREKEYTFGGSKDDNSKGNKNEGEFTFSDIAVNFLGLLSIGIFVIFLIVKRIKR